jgi:hypothetical protein
MAKDNKKKASNTWEIRPSYSSSATALDDWMVTAANRAPALISPLLLASA